MNSRGNTTLARLVCDERTARQVADLLSDNFDSAATAVAAFEGTDRRWNVELHFGTPPDEAIFYTSNLTLNAQGLTKFEAS